MSPSWGRRVSDKQLTRECGIIQNLLPGDIVLADRGFNIAEDIAMVQASLHIPAFTKGVSQLSPTEVESMYKHETCNRSHKITLLHLLSTVPIHFMIKKVTRWSTHS